MAFLVASKLYRRLNGAIDEYPDCQELYDSTQEWKRVNNNYMAEQYEKRGK